MKIEKTLCKQCLECEEYTYQRTITKGKRKSEGENELKWASQLLKIELEHKNKEKYNQKKYKWKSV